MAIIQATTFRSGTIDMQFLGEAMLNRPEILADIIANQWADQVPLLNLFSQLGISTQEDQTLNAHSARWQIFGSTFPDSYIVSVSNPNPRVGEEFTIEIKNGWFKNGASLRLAKKGHNIVLNGDGRRNPKSTVYRAQYIGNDKTATVPNGLLAAGQRVEFLAGVYGEASEKGHPIRYATGDYATNISTTIRTDTDITGHAAVNATLQKMLTYTDNYVDPVTGDPVNFSAALPLYYKGNRPLLLAHLMSIEKQLMEGVGNFNPLTGEIYNTDDRGEILSMGDGFWRQLDGIAKEATFSMREPIESFVAKLEGILQYVSQKTGVTDPTIYAVTGTLGKRLLQQASRYIRVREGVQIHVNAAATGVTTVDGGIRTGDIITDYGTIKIVYNRYADSLSKPSERVSRGGSSFPAESGDIAFIFKADDMPKPNIRIFDVAGEFQGQPINRGLVFKSIPGLSGFGNTFKGSFEAAAAVAPEWAATGKDAISHLTLSEKMLIVDNPTEFGVMYCQP